MFKNHKPTKAIAHANHPCHDFGISIGYRRIFMRIGYRWNRCTQFGAWVGEDFYHWRLGKYASFEIWKHGIPF